MSITVSGVFLSGRASVVPPPVLGYALFGGGGMHPGTGTYYNYTDKYTYSNNSRSAGTVLGLARRLLSACGDSIVGIFAGV